MTFNRRMPRITLRDELTLEDFSGSLNQAAPPDKVPVNDFLRFQNARVSDDGKSFERRPGTVKIASFAGKRILGAYGINDSEETKLLACLNDDIQLKSGGAWSSVFTPTSEAISPVQVAQHKGLTFIAGYEKPIMVRNGVGLYPGLEPPAQAPMAAAVASGSEVLAEGYDETNVDHLGELRQNAARTLLAQSFKAMKTIAVSQVKLQLRKVGSPTGNIWVEIHSGTSGTSATKNASAGILGQASDNIDVSTLTDTFVTRAFSFSGTKPSLQNGSTYFIVVYGDFTLSSSDFVLVGFDSTTPGYIEGKYYEVNDSMAWSGNDNVDLVFEVNGAPGDLELIDKAGSEETGASNVLRSSTARVILAQTFEASKGVDVYKVLLSLSRERAPSGTLWVEIHAREETAIRVQANEGATTIEVDSTAGMVAGDTVGITLDEDDEDDQSIHFSTVQSVMDADTVVITDAIPAGRTASVDALVFFQKPTSLTKNASAGIVGLASETVNAGDLVAEPEAHNEAFYFTADEPQLVAGKTYYIMLYGDFPISSSDYVRWSQTMTGSGLDAFRINSSGVWASSWPSPFWDYCFEAWGYETANTTAAQYPLANLDTYNGLRETAAQTLFAQSFIATFSGVITKIQLYLAKFGSPTGNIWAEIHQSQEGTSGSKNSSTYQVGQASDNLDVSTLDAFPTFGVKTLPFSGTKPTLVKGTIYYIVVYGDFAVSPTAFVKIGIDKDAPETSGCLFEINGSFAWTQRPGAGLVYYIWRAAGDIAGVYSYVVTFVRAGNYPCESNPSPASLDVTVVAGESVSLTGIPVSADQSVTARNIYRTEADGATHKWLRKIDDNTTTSITDNANDASLGPQVSYGNARPPGGSTIEVWDGRLWVGGVPGYEEFLFPSGLDTPEQFDMTYNVMLREREAGKVLRIMEFANELWAFKAASVWKVARTGDSYIVDKLVEDVGLGAVGSAVRCGKDMLLFLSNHKKIEILTPTGLAQAELPISAKVRETLASINATAIHKCVAGNYVERGEYRLAVPTGSNTEPDTVIVFNYLRGTFGLDAYPFYPASMNLTDHAAGSRSLLMGSSSGSLYRVDEAVTTDDGAGITMDVQTGWLTTPNKVKIFRTFLDYVLPETKTMSFRIYRNFEGTPAWDKTLDGNTPAGTGPELRNTIRAKLGMAIQGKAFSFRFVNSDDAKVKVSRINAVVIHREKGQGVQAA